jgi:hypothetical protein
MRGEIVDVRSLRQQIEREHREIRAAAELMVARRSRISTLAEYRARRAAELAMWNRWPEEIRWAIAREEP